MAALARQAARFPDLLPEALVTDRLSPRDAAFAHAIYTAAIQRWHTIEFLCTGFMRDPFPQAKAEVRAALLAGAAQMLLLDRVPAHAAIDESVEWLKDQSGKGPAGFVNAVLRKVARLVRAGGSGLNDLPHRSVYRAADDELPLSDGRAAVLGAPVLPENALERLSVCTSTPLPLLKEWTEQFGPEEARRIALHGLFDPPVTLNVSFEKDFADPHATPHSQPGHAVFSGSPEDLGELMRHCNHVWVQDASAGHAVRNIADLKPTRIVDLCAGQGTKTRQLALTFPNAEVIATDVDPERLRSLAATGALYPNVKVMPYDKVERIAAAWADLVLTDVPCSNAGVLPRRDEAKYRCGPSQLARILPIQQDVLTRANAMLRPEGAILYSTCSIDRRENDEQVTWASEKFGLKIERQHTQLPTGLPGEPASEYRDGAFSALLRKR